MKIEKSTPMLKIEESELKSLQEVVSAINSMKSSIGEIEVKKHETMHRLFRAEEDLHKFQVSLKEKYGDVSINLSDGSIKPVEDGVNQEN